MAELDKLLTGEEKEAFGTMAAMSGIG